MISRPRSDRYDHTVEKHSYRHNSYNQHDEGSNCFQQKSEYTPEKRPVKNVPDARHYYSLLVSLYMAIDRNKSVKNIVHVAIPVITSAFPKTVLKAYAASVPVVTIASHLLE